MLMHLIYRTPQLQYKKLSPPLTHLLMLQKQVEIVGLAARDVHQIVLLSKSKASLRREILTILGPSRKLSAGMMLRCG
jgi:hypothetical protein